MNLVVQGGVLARDALAEVALLARAAQTIPLGGSAWRFAGVTQSSAVEQWCAARRVDCAWVPEDRRLGDVRLVAMDMDSTLVTIESIDEMGDLLGIRDQIAAVTEQAMRGEIDYPESLRRRVALLAGLEEQALERICEERMQLSPGAETLVRRCRAAGIRTLLVSGGFSFFTAWLRDRLGIDAMLANELEIVRGRLTGRVVGGIIDGAAKAIRVHAEIAALDTTSDRVVAIGDGANDIPMMAAAGVSIAYRAKPIAREHATHTLDHSGLDGVLNLFL
jgi:phosphoserine phosphatase